MSPNIDGPKLSVIMPNYNHAHYIGEALEAILGQSFKPSEVIVVDDASTDDSVNVIEKFVKRDPTVRLFKNEYNMGVLSSLNRGLQYASGDYIYFTAADDKVLPGLFAKSIEMLELYPQSGLCCSDIVCFNNLKDSGHIKFSNLSDSSCYLSSEEMIKVMRKRLVTIFAPTCIYRRSAWMEGSGFVQELKWNSDWLPIHVIIFRHGVCYIPGLLASQRILNNSYSFTGGRNWKLQKKTMKNLIHFLELPSYADMQAVFRRTHSLAVFGLPMLYVLLRHRKNWKFLSCAMILRLLRYELKAFLGLNAPFFLKRLYYRIYKTDYNVYA